MLHRVWSEVKGPPVWCGPTSISAVTGVAYDEVVEAIHLYRDERRDIGAMCDHELVGVLGYLGFSTQTFEPSWGYGLLYKYIQTYQPHEENEILSTRSHFTAVDYVHMVDTKTYGEIIPLHMAPRMWCVVEHAITVRRMASRRPSLRVLTGDKACA